MAHIEDVMAIVGTFGTISLTVWTLGRIYLRKLELSHRAPPALGDGAIAQRLERIEQAVDAIAVEMERVSEGQRFTTKLLADRAAARPGMLGAPGRVDTPH